MPNLQFYYAIPGVLGKPGRDILIQAHVCDDEIILDHAWSGNYDLLPDFQFEELMNGSWMTDQWMEAAEEYRRDGVRESKNV